MAKKRTKTAPGTKKRKRSAKKKPKRSAGKRKSATKRPAASRRDPKPDQASPAAASLSGAALRRRKDESVAEAARAKLDQGLALSSGEIASINRVEQAALARAYDLLVAAALPKKWLEQLTGRGRKVLGDQALRFNLPIGNGTWRLPEVLRGYHDALGRLSHIPTERINQDEMDLFSGPATPSLERYRAMRADREQLKLEEERRNLIPRDELHQALQRFAAVMRQYGERIGKNFGRTAAEMLGEGITSGMLAMDAVMKGTDVDDQTTP